MSRSKKLYNSDLAPTPSSQKKWGWFEIFNVWANDVQSLFGYTLAASLFLASGLNGWAVFLALILAGFFIMWLVNLSGKPSVKHGIPYPVFARVSMGVFGANFPAMARGLVAMFWYGAQTYAASTAVALLITSVTGVSGGSEYLGMSGVMWISFIFVSLFQVYLFWQGIDLIRRFLNFAGPAVYVVMIVLMLAIWAQAGGTETYMQRLKNQSTRDSIRKEVAAGTGGVPPRFDTWIISDVESDTNQNLVGRSIAEVAEQRNVDPAEATLQLEEEERGAVSAVVHGRAERDVEYFLSHPIGMIGSDGNAVSPTGSQSQKQIHPRFYGTYPRILGRYVREQSLISLETAIEKMTGMPAARLGITDRGQVLEGLVADLVIFDQKKIIDHSTFEKPHQLSEGIQYLLVNGETVISNGIHTQSRAGRVLRRRK